jgi:hypothetical protein
LFVAASLSSSRIVGEFEAAKCSITTAAEMRAAVGKVDDNIVPYTREGEGRGRNRNNTPQEQEQQQELKQHPKLKC